MDLRGIEPLSENLSNMFSTIIVFLFLFPYRTVERHTVWFGSFINFVIASKLWRNRLPSFLMPVVSSMACESRQQLYAAFANCTLAIMFNSDFMTQIRDCEWLTYLSYPRRNLDRPVIVFLLFYAVIQVFVNNRFVNFFIFFSRIFFVWYVAFWRRL